MSLETNVRRSRLGPGRAALALSLAAALPGVAQEGAPRSPGPRVLLSAPLPEAPGMRLTVVELASGPNPGASSTSERPGRGHRHPGPVLVYVTRGALRMGLEGQPVRVVRAGETFFEPGHALHVVGENASATEPAHAIAVMLVPDGEPLTVPEPD